MDDLNSDGNNCIHHSSLFVFSDEILSYDERAQARVAYGSDARGCPSAHLTGTIPQIGTRHTQTRCSNYTLKWMICYQERPLLPSEFRSTILESFEYLLVVGFLSYLYRSVTPIDRLLSRIARLTEVDDVCDGV